MNNNTVSPALALAISGSKCFFEFLLLFQIRFGGKDCRFTECHSDGSHEDAYTLRTSLDAGPLFDTGCRFLGGSGRT
jgi:hypothetical protein